MSAPTPEPVPLDLTRVDELLSRISGVDAHLADWVQPLRAEVGRLRAEGDRLRPVVDAAANWVEARGGWMTDDPDRRATEWDLALIAAVDALGPDAPVEPALEPEPRLNVHMVARLRKCAADTSPNWDGKITIYPPEARELVALIDEAADGGEPR